ncbi:MAG: alanine--tRNA ligase [Patescibacteria group bacterium]|nr:alanine--tRNA ligase [Patescibacteria group bacterium]MDW8279703.1 alanine--tRNA ligase [bacterium]
MTHFLIREKFLNFFKKNNHVIVPSSSLIPSDKSVLLTTAGMQQFKPYYIGELDPISDFNSKNTTSIQKCFRTSDIDEVGDESHLTFFEMLGNFSFGGYFKKEAILLAYEFLNKELNLEIDYVTIFDPSKVASDDWRKNVPEDKESFEIWRNLGFEESRIKKEGIDNFWGPTGNEGPCGPTTEIYIKNKNNQSIEIWNIVFNEYFCDKNKILTPLKTNGVDTGMGLERLLMICQNKFNIFETDLFDSLLKILPTNLDQKIKRIISDHIKASVFLIADGVLPSNKEAGYILRRILRRAIVYEYIYKFEKNILNNLIYEVIKIYKEIYSELITKEQAILEEILKEKEKFYKTLDRGLKELKKRPEINSKIAFYLYETFGLPYEIIKELGGQKALNLNYDDFKKEFENHQEISRRGQEKKFGGHGLILDTKELKASSEEEIKKVIRLHTATHLLQQALREVLGNEVRQAGSDINPERTRFDFTFNRKLTQEEIKKVENIVNQKINEDLPVNFVEMKKEDAEKIGALSFFKEKYPPIVKVYFVGSKIENAWSKEFCGGPHVLKTGEIGKFVIQKEEGIGSGIRRIRAIVLP